MGRSKGYEIGTISEEVDELRELETEVAEILAEEDIVHLAAWMENGSTAGVLVWENKWAAPFASAARHAGGQLIASGPDPDPGDRRLDGGKLETGRSLRCHYASTCGTPRSRRGVPSHRTAAVVGTAAVVAHGVDRRQDRRDDRRDGR